MGQVSPITAVPRCPHMHTDTNKGMASKGTKLIYAEKEIRFPGSFAELCLLLLTHLWKLVIISVRLHLRIPCSHVGTPSSSSIAGIIPQPLPRISAKPRSRGYLKCHKLISYLSRTKSVYSNFKLIPVISKEHLDKTSFLEIISCGRVLG